MIAKDNDNDNDDENNAQRPVTNSVIVTLQINVFTNNICRMNITGFLMGYHSHRPC